jgi:hypothetical protein
VGFLHRALHSLAAAEQVSLNRVIVDLLQHGLDPSELLPIKRLPSDEIPNRSFVMKSGV